MVSFGQPHRAAYLQQEVLECVGFPALTHPESRLYAMAVDSTATFKRRALQVGLLNEDLDTMSRLGWTTYGTLALASEGQPGQVADDKFKTSVIDKVLAPEHAARAAPLKRLYLESYSACLVDIKRTVENTGEEAVPRVPEVEKMARLDAFRKKYPGARVSGIHEPASSLIDEFVQMVRTGHVRYLEWAKLISRDDEIAAKKKAGLKHAVKWTAEHGSIVATSDQPDSPDTSLTSDYLVRCALHRRAVAVHVAGLLDFQTHELASEMFFERRFEPCPAGYRPVTFEQIQQADEKLWKHLANQTRGGTTDTGASIFPADAFFEASLRHPEVDLHLRPLPQLRQPDARATSIASSRPGPKAKARARSNDTPSDQPPSKRRRAPRMPDALKDGLPSTESGSAICFAYNMSEGCASKVAAGGRCGRGLHVCCKKKNNKACGMKHPAFEHRD